jgi:spore coat protein U-like protein
MNGYSQFSCNRINAQNAMAMTNTGVYDEQSFPIAVRTTAGVPRIMPVMYTLEFVEEIDKEPGLPDNPAIWETEPDTIPKVDIYYEASGYNPLVLTEETKNIALPIGSEVSHAENSASVSVGTTIHTVGYDPVVTLAVGGTHTGGWYILTNVGTASLLAPLVGGSYITVGSNLNITKPDGSIISVKVTGHSNATSGYSYVDSGVVIRSRKIYISDNLYKDSTYTLNWHNCFAFGNGVESNRIRDSFNKVYITNGVKASTTLDKELREEHRKHGLIYSGIYNSNSGVNNLNQFIMAEKITKDLPPSYGSIQKLYSRNSDLVTFCEDRVIQIFADKDALYNADGDINLVSSNAVLGQAQPFSGEYGISTNPESFASEAYRAYFTDRVRGAVLRLSMDGLTAISDHGMKDWFRDNLSLGKTNLLGENCLDSQANWDISNNNATARLLMGRLL